MNALSMSRALLTSTLFGLIASTTAQNITESELNLNCTGLRADFTEDGMNVTNMNITKLGEPFRITSARICPENSQPNSQLCSLNTYGDSAQLDIEMTSNFSDISNASVFADVVREAIRAMGGSEEEHERPMRIADMDYDIVNDTDLRLEPGEAGYVQFTPEMSCFDGKLWELDPCPTQDEAAQRTAQQFNNTPISICIPKLEIYRRSGKRAKTWYTVLGSRSLVKISQEEAQTNEMRRSPTNGEAYNLTTGQLLGTQNQNGPSGENDAGRLAPGLLMQMAIGVAVFMFVL